jgi:DNA-binding CsgD family transcriptional regulator/ArsR family metal-binding transcriptional regulator
VLISKYHDFYLSKTGVMFGHCLGAHFKLDNDIRSLFPYINTAVKDSRYFEKPAHIQFVLDDVQCTLYSNEVIAAPFMDQEQAEKFVVRLIDFLNAIYFKRDSMTPDHKTFRPVSVIDLYKLLPQTNCKACGFSTCLAFAGALSKKQTTTDQCPGFARPLYENAVYPIYDKEGNLATTVEIEVDTKENLCGGVRIDESDARQEEISDELIQNNNTVSQKNSVEVHTELTDREIQVLALVSEGATNIEISEALSISRHTVKSHVVNIFNKLGVNDRTQAAVWATRHGVI